MRTPWERGIEAAERNNKPGLSTAFIGFEWTQHVQGNNQHRVLVFRDGADRAKQVLPFSACVSAYFLSNGLPVQVVERNIMPPLPSRGGRPRGRTRMGGRVGRPADRLLDLSA